MFLVKSLGLLLCLLVTLVNAGNTVVGYFPNWLYAKYPVSSIPFSKYTHIHYAFAIMTEGNTPKWTDDANTETQLTDLVSNAHKSNTKVLISVGGWSGSITFSSMASSAPNRKEFIQWNVDQIKKYNTDGVDIDWEYPGRQGAGCNVVGGSDITNYATLLKELRDTLDQEFEKGSKEISIAGDAAGFSGTSADITSIGQSVTRVNMMTYDINGAWNPQTGPNAPLKTSKGVSFSSAIDTWTSLGVPANKLTGGLAFYGRSTTAKGDMSDGNMYQDQAQGAPPKGDSNDAPYQDPFCAKDPGGLSGIWSFNNMMSEGLLDTPLTAKEPWVRHWDDESSTPWLFNPQSKVFLSYDDPKSIGIKANEAKSRGLDGIMIWSVNQDTSNSDLLSATGF